MDNFTIKVITPAGLALEEKASSVTLPSEEGEICFLPGHANYSGVLKVGLLEYQTASGQVKRFVISGGFCQYNESELSILADEVDFADTVNKDLYSKNRENLKATVESLESDESERESARLKLLRIEAIDNLISH